MQKLRAAGGHLELAADGVIVENDYALEGPRPELGEVLYLVLSVVYYGAVLPVDA